MEKLPELIEYEISLENFLKKTLKNLKSDNFKILADEYNFNIILNKMDKITGLNYENLILIESPTLEKFSTIRNLEEIDTTIAIGGCSVLDMGRSVGLKNLILIPSILSTSCISINQAIIYDNFRNHIVIQTNYPSKVFILWPLILNTDPHELKKWSSSGFGDLFGNISSTIEYLFEKNYFKKGDNIIKKLEDFYEKNNSLNYIKILEWLLNSFKEYDKFTLRFLALSLHEASIHSSKLKNLSFNSEHILYYNMYKFEEYSNKLPTHGQIVSIGVLLSAKLIEIIFKDENLYSKLKSIYKKLGLPTTYEELERIGITKEAIIRNLAKIHKETFLGRYINDKIVDSVYQ